MSRGERAIGPVGTAGRIAGGAFFLGPFLWLFAAPDLGDLALGLLVFPAVFVLWQVGYQALVGRRLVAVGPLAMTLNLALAILLFSIDPTRAAAALFVGASLLLAAYRGYAGCEATAISNWILRRDDQIGCVMLAPLDAVDAGARGDRDPLHGAAER